MTDPPREARADVAFHAVRAPSYDRDVTSEYAIYDRLALTPLLDRAGAGPGTTVLDVGCGTGAATMLLARRGATVHGVDHSPDMLDVAMKKVQRGGLSAQVSLIVAEAWSLPYADATFDGVVCQRVLHHIADPRPALAEMARVLRPGGWLCLSDTVNDPTPAARVLRRLWRRVLARIEPPPAPSPTLDMPPIEEVRRTVGEVSALLHGAGFAPELRLFTHVAMMDRMSARRRAAVIQGLSYPWRTRKGDVLFAFATKPETP